MRKVKTVPMWDIIKFVLLDQIMYFMVLVVFLHGVFPFIFKGSPVEETYDQKLEGRDPAVWHVGLKVAWDIETPGLAVPLRQGDFYLMLGNFQGARKLNVLLKTQKLILECKLSHFQLGLVLARQRIWLENIVNSSYPAQFYCNLGIFFLTMFLLLQTEKKNIC